MTLHRNKLPQLADQLFLTDGGLETTMIFHHGIELPQFAAFDLLSNPEGRQKLLEYYDSYANLAQANGLGFIFETVSWRAGPDWVAKVGYPDEAVESICRESVDILLALRDRYHSDTTPMVISGQLGPRGDGYTVESAMSADEAQAYHSRQVQALAATPADMISALTLNYSAEAIGIARAAQEADMHSVISFTVETDGCLPTGQSLADAIDEVDDATDGAPAYYMINCAHTTHFADVLEDEPWTRRIRAIRANASCLSHAELDECTELDEGNPILFGHQHAELLRHFPHITIMGGCCGTDLRHIQSLVKNLLRDAA